MCGGGGGSALSGYLKVRKKASAAGAVGDAARLSSASTSASLCRRVAGFIVLSALPSSAPSFCDVRCDCSGDAIPLIDWKQVRGHGGTGVESVTDTIASMGGSTRRGYLDGVVTCARVNAACCKIELRCERLLGSPLPVGCSAVVPAPASLATSPTKDSPRDRASVLRYREEEKAATHAAWLSQHKKSSLDCGWGLDVRPARGGFPVPGGPNHAPGRT